MSLPVIIQKFSKNCYLKSVILSFFIIINFVFVYKIKLESDKIMFNFHFFQSR